MVINASPHAGFAEAIAPEMHRVAKELVTCPANLSDMDLPALVTDRGGASNGLQDLVAAIACGINSDRGHESGC